MEKKKMEVRRPSAVPVYGIGVCFILCAVIFPLYKLGFLILTVALSAAAFFVLKKLFPGEIYYVDAPLGDADTDELIRTGGEQLARIRRAADGIKDPAVRQDVLDIAGLGDRILENLTPQNKKSSGVRTFMNYYLPTVAKLCESYDILDDQGIAGENITASMESIKNSLGMVKTAFTKELDNMFSDSGVDIESDIAVFAQMMEREGLK